MYKFLPGVGLVKALLMLFDDSFKKLADLAEHLKPCDNNEEDDTDGEEDGAPSFDLVLDEKFTKVREEGKGGKCICEQLFHQSDKL